MSDLLDAYSGEHATKYDEVRSRSARWTSEVTAMESLLRESQAKTVADCPFGTGRWIPQYKAIGAEVIGIDLSEGMLKQAKIKLQRESESVAARFHLIKGSIFDLPHIELPNPPDLIVCVRFINWLCLSDASRAIESLSAFPAKRLILGASVVPAETHALRRAWMRLSLRFVNLRNRGRPRQYVHDEAALRELVGRCGWRLAARLFIFESSSRMNYFYCFVRD